MTTIAVWPMINAIFNATSACLLVAGFGFIRAKRIPAHLVCMVSACVVSTVFFISYLLYHAHVGSVAFTGQGGIRRLYLTILISHSILAIVIVPLVIRTLWLALRKRIDDHRRWAKRTLPLWLYVCITGVVVYWMLYWWTPAVQACPMCQDALLDPGQAAAQSATWKAYVLSIATLMGVPMLLVGGLVTWVVRTTRLHRR